MTISRPETIDGSLNIQSVGYVIVDQRAAETLNEERKHTEEGRLYVRSTRQPT